MTVKPVSGQDSSFGRRTYLNFADGGGSHVVGASAGETRPREVERCREFLVISIGSTGSLTRAACSPVADAPTTTATPSTAPPASTTSRTTNQPRLVAADYWDLPREVQRRVRASPDNVAWAELEKAKDAKRLGDAAGLFPAIPTEFPGLLSRPTPWR